MFRVGLSQTLDLNASLNGGAADTGVTYEATPGSAAVLTVNSTTGVVTPVAAGVGVVLVKDGTGVVVDRVTVSVLADTEMTARDEIEAGTKRVVVTGTPASAVTPFTGATGGLPILVTTDSVGAVLGSGVRTDPFAANLLVALPLTEDASDKSHLVKGNGSAVTVTNYGSNVTFSSSQSRFYGKAALFNSNDDRITLTQPTPFGTGDFTVELWLYATDVSAIRIIAGTRADHGGYPNAWSFGIDPVGRLSFGGNYLALYADSAVPVGQWRHFAFVRYSGALKLFINGSEAASASFTQNLTDTGITIGNLAPYSYPFQGCMQDLRLYTTAKYTSNFTVPS